MPHNNNFPISYALQIKRYKKVYILILADIFSVEFRKKLLEINQAGSLFDSKVKEVYIEEIGFV